MKIKVCGLKYRDNISGILDCNPDFVGFIFYEGSPRYVGSVLDAQDIKENIREVSTVGVFVNETASEVVKTYRDYGLNYVQLHGDEEAPYCALLQQDGVRIIKVFQVDNEFNFTSVQPYTHYVDFFLFDTRGNQRGGTGRKFDWHLLNKYTGNVPFMLSGGIAKGDIESIIQIGHPQLYGVDINSRFEVSPGVKDVKLVSDFIKKLRDEIYS